MSHPDPGSFGDVSSRLSTLIGRVISDRYRVTELIATGGTAAVYLAQHVHMLKLVALKVLDPRSEQLPELVARFRREAIAGAHVHHPNIAGATDFGQLEDGPYFLVLEYVPGQTLDKIIARGPMPVTRAAKIVRQIASGLQAAHDVGVIHRDVKPSNVMLVEAEGDLVKLIDFGFAQVKFAKMPTLAPPTNEAPVPEPVLTAVGIVLGTVAYMAPEAALGMSAVDERSDLYACGLILYQLLTGRHPFDATDPVELFLQQRTSIPLPLAESTPGLDVPAALEALVMRLLEKDPRDRYPSARDLIAALDGVVMTLAFESVPEVMSPNVPALFAVEGSSASEPLPDAAPAEVLETTVGAPATSHHASPSLDESKPPPALPRQRRFGPRAYAAVACAALLVCAWFVVARSRRLAAVRESSGKVPAAVATSDDVPRPPAEGVSKEAEEGQV